MRNKWWFRNKIKGKHKSDSENDGWSIWSIKQSIEAVELQQTAVVIWSINKVRKLVTNWSRQYQRSLPDPDQHYCNDSFSMQCHESD